MTACRHCGSPISTDQKFCPQCGQALDAPADATVRLQTPLLGRPRPPVSLLNAPVGSPRGRLAIQDLFGGKTRLLVGRAPECDVCLPHPLVSRVHALVERLPEGLRLRDLGSVNGVLIDGRRIDQPTFLRDRQRIGIGPYLFNLQGDVFYSLDNSRSVRLEARALERAVRLPGGQRKLLDNINLVLEPGEFVSLLGPSGSGKSTLMDCLNGRRRATGGQVLANGEDFYRHFDNFRQSLGYVPQRDIVHTQLTVAQALYYTARLRLPPDTGPQELRDRLEEVVHLMELAPHRDTLVANLSGGQIKRVSLGAELLARPCLLYIDEATSGLDAGTEARMMSLFRQLSDEGKSILCITHNVDNVDLCHLIVLLARGRLVYFGPPRESLAYFGVSRLSEIYDRLGQKAPEEWERQFAASSLYQEFVAKRLSITEPDSPPAPALAPPPAPASERPHRLFLHQFWVLTCRNAELLWKDRRTLRLLLLQAPVVALFILLGFINKPYQDTVLAPRRLTDAERQAVLRLLQERKEVGKLDPEGQVARLVREQLDPEGQQVDPLSGMLDPDVLETVVAQQGPVMPDKVIVNPRYTYMLLFLVVITTMWFGCNNAAKEIVKEEAIYARERAVNLGIGPYLASKFTVLTVVSAVQPLLLMLVIYGVLGVLDVGFGLKGPPAIYRLGYLPQFGVLLLLAMTGSALGLLLSACVASPDRATTLLPYVLIPQIILGGGIMPVHEEPMHLIAMVTSPAYWAYRAVRLGETTLPPDFPGRMDYQDTVWLPCVALLVQMAGLLALTAWALRRKDVT